MKKSLSRPHLSIVRILAGCISALAAGHASAAVVTLNASDAIGTTSFNTGLHWDNGLAPSAGNDYFTGAFGLRSPVNPVSAIFAGDSLTINAGGSLGFKTAGPTTINNLIVAGGILGQSLTGAVPEEAKLAGVMTVTADSTIDTTTGTGRILTIDSLIHGGGGLLLTGTTGTVNFNNVNNDYTGVITLGGALSGRSIALVVPTIGNVGAVSGLGAGSAGVGNLIFDGGTLRISATGAGGVTDRQFTLTTFGGTIDSSGTGLLNFNNAGAAGLTGSGARTLTLAGTNTGNNTLAASLADNGGATGLTKSGAGTWIVTGNSSYTGTTNVTAGILEFTTANSLGAANAPVTVGAATLRWGVGNAASFNAGRLLTLTGAATLNTNGNNIAILGLVAGAGGFTKAGGGILTLSGANTFSGNVSVGNGGGGIRITNSSALGTGTKTISVIGNTGGSNTPTLRLDGSAGNIILPGSFSVTASADGLNPGNLVPGFQNEAGNNAINGNVTITSGGGGVAFQVNAGTLALNGTVTPNTTSRTLLLSGVGNGTVNGVVQNQNATNTLGLRKDGTGTWVLNGANTYTVSTLVNAGTLVTNTASTGAAPVTVAANANLGVRIAAAGQTFNITSLTMAAGTSLALRLGSFGNPTVPVVNATTFTPSATVNVSFNGTHLTPGTITLIDYGTIGGGGFAALNLVLPPRAAGTLVNNVGNTSVDLNLTAFDFPRWSGENSANWDVNDGTPTGTQNWREFNSGSLTRYLQGAAGTDGVLFDDSATTPGANNVNLTTTLTPTALTVDNPTLTYTFSGTGKISGTTGLAKRGNGTLILANTGGNDYAGPTTIGAGGTLQVGDGATAGGGQLGSGGVTVDGTLLLNRPDDFTISNTISGAGRLTKQGTNKAILSSALTYTGLTTISGGTLQIDSPSVLAGDVLNNGTLILTGAATLNGAISGGGPLTIQATGTKTLGGATANTYNGLTTVSGGTLALNKSAGTNAIAADVLVDGGTLSWSQADQIADTASITVTSGAVNTGNRADTIQNLTINSATTSTFSGLIINGTLTVTTGTHDAVNSNGTLFTNAAVLSGGSTSRLGANSPGSTWNIGTGGLTLNGATIQLGNAGAAVTALVTLASDVSASGTNAISVVNNTGPRLLDLQAATRVFSITGGTTTVTPTVQNGGITKAGNGTLVLNGAAANTMTNLTTVSGGILQLSKTAGLNAVGGDVLINGTGQLVLTTANQIPDTSSLTYNSSGTNTTFGNETLANITVLGGSETSQLILNGSVTVNTKVTVNAGVLSVASGGTVTTSALDISAGVVRVSANSNASTLNVNGPLTATGGEVQVGQALGNFDAVLNLGGDYAGSGTVVFNRGGYTGPNKREINLGGAARTFDVTSGTTTVAPDLRNGTVVKTGAGTLTLNGAQGYSALTATGGVTNINANAVGATITANATVNFGSSQTLTALDIGDGAVATLGNPAAAFAGATVADAFIDESGMLAPNAASAVPEPGATGLLLLSAIGFLSRRYRAARRLVS